MATSRKHTIRSANCEPESRGIESKQVQRRWLILVALAIVCRGGISQDLPPGVLLLSRIQAHMKDKFERLPDYTCLETIRRFHRAAGTKGGLKPLDTVRLDILYSRHQDLYAFPGERQFQEKAASNLIGSGMIGTGFVTLALKNVLLGSGSVLTYRGEEELDGRKVVRYDFRLSRLQSGYTLSVFGGQGVVGMAGSFLADPQTLEVVKMEDRAEDFPPFLPVEAATTAVEYARARIGDRDEVLPQSAELYMRQTSGDEDRDFFDFTHCGSFRSESAIHFGKDAAPAAETRGGSRLPAAPAAAQQRMPALLAIAVELSTRITDTDSVGTPIEGRVSADVRHKGSVLVARGSLLRGRVRRLERPTDVSGHFIVGLEFTEIQVNGTWVRFYADLLKLEKARGIDQVLRRPVSPDGPSSIEPTETISLPDLPGVASFFVSGKTLLVPQGLQMVWRTRGPLN